MNRSFEWLLTGPPWVEYRTRLDLMGEAEGGTAVQTARRDMLSHPQIQMLLAELADWPGPLLKSHKDAKHPLHKLAFIADLGLRAGEPGVDAIIERILAHRAAEGPFQVIVNINPRYGGTGEDQWAWMLCDAPLILYALAKFGLANDARVETVVAHLITLQRDNGWPCAVSPDLGKFRGPGRKADPCPYANLLMLKLLALRPDWRDSSASRTAAETLLTLWEQRTERRPYLFAMGSGFAKLKAPLIWYDILHVLDVLTRFPWLRGDVRLNEMAGIVQGKGDENGRYVPESIWTAWKEWDFGQKRQPSPWLTFLVQRALKRNH